MKMKNMAMAVMALAVSAMAGSAFAAEVPSKPVNSTNTMQAQLVTMPALSLEQMAKEKGIFVEELIAQLKKSGELKNLAPLQTVKIKPIDGSEVKEGTLALKTISLKAADAKGNENETAMLRVFSIEDMAKEQGISVDQLTAQLEKKGIITKDVATFSATFDLKEVAKEQGLSVEELIAKLQKEGKLTQAATLVPATPVQK
ncbi:hypothetical protein [Brevibacillus nitrificans]|uniref:hypothetical protein n=1 Tax=Brevibacillus nitrificans TaxID=651560 RepID=UPI00285E8D5F|nr:hypothetical protein [Brevibacillus nitrificans]MDR7315130.1 putative DNA-binding ribbon-helix-helix protein [Brevibacillus nitrificans]